MTRRLSNFRPDRDHPNLVFWICFVTLNALLFLPLYLLNQETTSFLPAASIFADGPWMGLSQLFIFRENQDLFRLSLELTLVTALWATVRWLRLRFLRYAIAVIYVLALGYYVYEAIMVSIYLVDPIFYSQYYLARDGLPFLAGHLQTAWWVYAAAVGGLAIAAAALVALVNLLLRCAAAPALRRASRIAITLLAGLCLTAGMFYQFYTAMPGMVVSSLGFKLQQNIAASLQLHADVASFDGGAVRSAYDYASFRLEKKPDIYFIFIESYGSILYKRADFRQAYTTLLTELEEQLDSAGWHAATALSESPMWGGGSWMAYTTTLFGLRIDNQPQYLSLFNKYQVDAYPSLGHTLQTQGYHYVWLSSLVEEYDDLLWARYARFYGVDELLRSKDLNYSGPRYGWGPALPDQYVMNYANDLLKRSNDKPLFLFTITQNSHYPWTPHPELVDDWRTLNRAQAEPATPDSAETGQAALRQRYLHAIEYQLRMLTEFILHNGDENSVFVLIGDHQPPMVSRRADGWATPVHIIAKDQALIDAFAAYDFTPGLQRKVARASHTP